MQRLRPLDIALLAIFVPLWVLCFALYLHNTFHGRLARIPLLVAAPDSAEEYPTLRAFWPGTGAEQLGLAVGDQLLQIGGADLRGVGPFGFTARVYEQVGPALRAPVVFLHEGVLDTRLLVLHPFAFPWRTLPLSLGFAVAAVVILCRRPGVRIARAAFLAGMTYSFHWTFFAGGPRWQTYAWIFTVGLSAFVMFPLLLRFALLLPEELAPPGARLPRWPWVFAVFGPSLMSRVFGVPFSPAFGLRAELVVTIAFIPTFLALLTRNFRRSGPLGRRQLKWAAYGIYIGTAPTLIADAIIGIDPSLWWLHESSTIFTALIPICLLIAIVRFNLFDIDRLISSTAAYSILLILCGAGMAIAVPALSTFLGAFVGLKHPVWRITLSLFFAAMVAPGQRYLRPQIERFFFAQRYALEQGGRQLQHAQAAQLTVSTFLTTVGEQLFTLLQAENCVMYGRTESEYVPIFVRGSGESLPFAAASPVLEVLQARMREVDVERWQRMVRTSLSQQERTVVDNLRVAAVVAIRHDEMPLVLICLGLKRSGDVYTPTDFHLLTELGQSFSQELERYTTSEITQQFVTMREEPYRSGS